MTGRDSDLRREDVESLTGEIFQTLDVEGDRKDFYSDLSDNYKQGFAEYIASSGINLQPQEEHNESLSILALFDSIPIEVL